MEKSTLLFLSVLCLLGQALLGSTERMDLGSVAGVVKDAVANNPIAGVEVRVPLWASKKNNDEWVYTTTTTDAQGAYSIALPLLAASASYNVEFSAPNYNPATISNVDVRPNEETVVETLSYIDRSVTGPGTIAGVVKNALTGALESGVTIHIRAGINVGIGPILRTLTTSANGDWSTSVETGQYTAQMSKGGFTNVQKTVFAIGRQTVGNQNALITPIAPPGQTRIVLSWGQYPYDLDSHCSGPQGVGRFHVYYGAKGSQHSSPYTTLDVDDTSSYGPETITIYSQLSGRYRYSVHDYSNAGSTNSVAMGNSMANVKVYQDGKLVRNYNIPTARGTLWSVFELNGFAITPINTMTYHQNAGSVP